MKRRRPVLVALPLFTIGVVTLSRFAHDVRSVVAVGLSGGGFAIGVGFALLVFGFSGQLHE